MDRLLTLGLVTEATRPHPIQQDDGSDRDPPAGDERAAGPDDELICRGQPHEADVLP